MSDFVLDASVMLRWVLPGEVPQLARRVRVQIAEAGLRAAAPALLCWEMANSVVFAERRQTLIAPFSQTWQAAEHWLALVETEAAAVESLRATCELARRFRLTAYDAAYLELALRRGLPLATLDEQLRDAARTAGVVVDL